MLYMELFYLEGDKIHYESSFSDEGGEFNDEGGGCVIDFSGCYIPVENLRKLSSQREIMSVFAEYGAEVQQYQEDFRQENRDETVKKFLTGAKKAENFDDLVENQLYYYDYGGEFGGLIV